MSERSQQIHSFIKARKLREKQVKQETRVGSQPGIEGPLFRSKGFTIFTCEKCGQEFRSRERHGRECKGQ